MHADASHLHIDGVQKVKVVCMKSELAVVSFHYAQYSRTRGVFVYSDLDVIVDQFLDTGLPLLKLK
jgi:hypothetical protein